MTQSQRKAFLIIMFVTLTLALACVGYFYIYSRGNSSSGIFAEERLASIVRTLYGATPNSTATSLTDLNNEYYIRDLTETLPEDSSGRVMRFQYYERRENSYLNILSVRYRNPRLARDVLADADLMPSGETNYLTSGSFSRTNLKEVTYTARRGITGAEEYTVLIYYVEGDSLVMIQFTFFPTIDDDGRARVDELCEALGVPVPPEPVDAVDNGVSETDASVGNGLGIGEVVASEVSEITIAGGAETAASSATETTEGAIVTAASETTM